MVRSLLLITALAAAGGVVVAPAADAASGPRVRALSVRVAPTGGGARVTVHGAGFRQVKAVEFGRTKGRSVHVSSASSLTVLVPRHPAGTVDVRVLTSHGRSATGSHDRFTYGAPPALASVSPANGSTAGGTQVTLRGRNLGHASVLFGSTPVRVSAAHAGSITVTAPQHPAGAVDVRAVTPFGTAVLPGAFSYIAPPIALSTTALAATVAGTKYLQVLAVQGGTAPLTWSATGLPPGLALGAGTGVLSGTVTGTGTSTPTITVTDAAGASASRTYSIAVPTSLPADCLDGSCSHLTAAPGTVQVPAPRIGSVLTDGDDLPSSVLLTGQNVTAGQTLALAPTVDVPSGAIVGVDDVSANPDGTSTADVTPKRLQDAYSGGVLTATGPATTAAHQPASIACDKPAVTAQLHGLTADPALVPTLTAVWGSGGPSLFQVDLAGSVTLNLGATVSAAATCEVDLAPVSSTVPVPGAGAMVLTVTPSVQFVTTGKVDLRTAVAFGCAAQYMWRQGGSQSRSAYCSDASTPLQLSAGGSVGATMTASLDTGVQLADQPAVTGTLTGTVRATDQPGGHPVSAVAAELDADLDGCLNCFWAGVPDDVTVASGPVIKGVIAASDSAPPAVPPAGAPAITTTTLPDAAVGQPYDAALQTADGRDGTWSVTSGSLPDGLVIDGDVIDGKALGTGSSAFTLGFVDGAGRSVSQLESLDVTSAGPTTGGAVQDLDYCDQHALDADSDSSSDAVALPFPVPLGGTQQQVFINNNGYVTFTGAASDFTPYALAGAPAPIIAPFFADLDSTDAATPLVTYGASADGKNFCVDWLDQGYAEGNTDKTVSVQLLLTDRSDLAPGEVGVTFDYGSIGWETGDDSGGTGGIGGSPAVAGYSDGAGNAVSLPGSGITGALLDGGPDSLLTTSTGSNVPGRDVYLLQP